MDNPETLATFDTRHRMKTNKIKTQHKKLNRRTHKKKKHSRHEPKVVGFTSNEYIDIALQ